MMLDEDETQKKCFMVLVNDEEQYSLWVEDKAIPPGWRAVGPKGARDDCLKYIEEVWTDMRPLSLRRSMEAGVQH